MSGLKEFLQDEVVGYIEREIKLWTGRFCAKNKFHDPLTPYVWIDSVNLWMNCGSSGVNLFQVPYRIKCDESVSRTQKRYRFVYLGGWMPALYDQENGSVLYPPIP